MNLEERKAELLKELEARYTAKQIAISEYSHKAQDIVDKLSQVRTNCAFSKISYRIRR